MYKRQDKHCCKNHSRKCVHGRPDAAADFTVNQGGQSIDAGAAGEVGDNKIIQRHGEGQQKAGQHAGQNVRKYPVSYTHLDVYKRQTKDFGL